MDTCVMQSLARLETYTCYNCNEQGHLSHDCKKPCHAHGQEQPIFNPLIDHISYALPHFSNQEIPLVSTTIIVPIKSSSADTSAVIPSWQNEEVQAYYFDMFEAQI